MKKKFYYKTPVDSNTGKALGQLMEKCQEVTKAADAFVSQCGAEEYIESPLGMAGGVSFVIFDNTPDAEIWRKVEVNGVDNCYEINLPDDWDAGKAQQRDNDAEPLTIPEQLEIARLELPVVNIMDLAVIFKAKKEKHIIITETPSFFMYHKPNTELGVVEQSYYICTPFVCESADMTAVDDKEFYRRRMAAMNVN